MLSDKINIVAVLATLVYFEVALPPFLSEGSWSSEILPRDPAHVFAPNFSNAHVLGVLACEQPGEATDSLANSGCV